MSREEDKIPTSHINRILKTMLPAEASVSKDFKSALSVAGIVFAHFITTLAVEIVNKKKRSTLLPEDILEALQEAEFGSYASEMQKEIGEA
jgi:histone H3/H4